MGAIPLPGWCPDESRVGRFWWALGAATKGSNSCSPSPIAGVLPFLGEYHGLSVDKIIHILRSLVPPKNEPKNGG